MEDARDHLTVHQRKKIERNGMIFAPQDISWRRAEQLAKLGVVTVYPFHQRWRGRVELATPSRPT